MTPDQRHLALITALALVFATVTAGLQWWLA